MPFLPSIPLPPPAPARRPGGCRCSSSRRAPCRAGVRQRPGAAGAERRAGCAARDRRVYGLAEVDVHVETDDGYAAQLADWRDGRRLRVLGTLPVGARQAAAESGTTILDVAPVCAGRREPADRAA